MSYTYSLPTSAKSAHKNFGPVHSYGIAPVVAKKKKTVRHPKNKTKKPCKTITVAAYTRRPKGCKKD